MTSITHDDHPGDDSEPVFALGLNRPPAAPLPEGHTNPLDFGDVLMTGLNNLKWTVHLWRLVAVSLRIAADDTRFRDHELEQTRRHADEVVEVLTHIMTLAGEMERVANTVKQR